MSRHTRPQSMRRSAGRHPRDPHRHLCRRCRRRSAGRLSRRRRSRSSPSHSRSRSSRSRSRRVRPTSCTTTTTTTEAALSSDGASSRGTPAATRWTARWGPLRRRRLASQAGAAGPKTARRQPCRPHSGRHLHARRHLLARRRHGSKRAPRCVELRSCRASFQGARAWAPLQPRRHQLPARLHPGARARAAARECPVRLKLKEALREAARRSHLLLPTWAATPARAPARLLRRPAVLVAVVGSRRHRRPWAASMRMRPKPASRPSRLCLLLFTRASGPRAHRPRRLRPLWDPGLGKAACSASKALR